MTVVDVLLLVARLLLAGVFVLAGVTKLADRPGSRRALIGFGLPERLAEPFVYLLPLAELVVAVALLPTATARYGAIGAVALLALFVAGMANSLARGQRPDCHCFGQLYSEPIGWQALARNGVLAVIAAFVAVVGWGDAGPSLVAWLAPLTNAERAVILGGAVGLALLAAQGALLVTLVRQNGRLLQRLDAPTAAPTPVVATAAPGLTAPAVAGLPGGSPAPTFSLPTVRGDLLTFEILRRLGKPVILLFSDPACGPCNALLPDIGRWQQEHADALTIVLLSRGTPEANRAKSSEHGLTWVLLQRDREVAEAYGVFGTPSAVLVHPDGTIGGPLAQGSEEIRYLVAQSARPATRPQPLPLAPAAAVAANGQHTNGVAESVSSIPQIGDPAPDFTLPSLDGVPVSLAQFRDRPTLVLFWNPGCFHCNRMLDDLKAWEARPATERAQLLVISTGTAEDNRALGLRSTLVLDPNFSVGPQYGVQGTPSAMLVDAEGRLATAVAVGAPAVFALVDHRVTPSNGAVDAGLVRTFGGVRPAPLTSLPPGAKPRQEECVEDELLSDGGIVLYNGCRQQVLTLNATAALVWEYCDGDHDVEAIIEEVRDVFPSAPDAERDVRTLLDELTRAGMVAPVAA